MVETSPIRIRKETRDRLKSIMVYGDTMDSKINDLLDFFSSRSMR